MDCRLSKWETVLLRRDYCQTRTQTRVDSRLWSRQYELSLNGKKAGDDLLLPGWTKYDRTCLYDTRDITPLLRQGWNAAGLLLGNGMYNVHGGRYTSSKVRSARSRPSRKSASNTPMLG